MVIKKEDIRDFLLEQPKLDGIDESVDSNPTDPTDALRQSELAKVALETLLRNPSNPEGTITWVNEYFTLINAGWKWRVAAYIAWASSKKIGRYPETQDAFAKTVLGLTSDRAIAKWRSNNPCIDEAIGIMQTYTMFDYRRDAIEAMGISASNPTKDGNRDRNLLFKMTGDFVPSLKIDDQRNPGNNDLATMPEEELRRLAAREKLQRGEGINSDDAAGE
jgi:hypothetical protein